MIVIKYKTRVYPEGRNPLAVVLETNPCCEGFEALIGDVKDDRFWGPISVKPTNEKQGEVYLFAHPKLPAISFCPLCGKSVEALEVERINMVKVETPMTSTKYVEEGQPQEDPPLICIKNFCVYDCDQCGAKRKDGLARPLPI